jgi:predicted amidohydrolase
VRDITVAAVHLHAEPGETESNLERIDAWTARLAAQGADAVCFPEMSICGYDRSSDIEALCQPIPGPATDRLCAIAARQRITLIAGLAESVADGRFHISQVIATPDGLAGVYQKAHLSPFEGEVFHPGDRPGVFPVDWCMWGMQLCYDSHFPEWSTLQALAGAEVLFVGFATPRDDPDSLHERLLRYLPARAYDNSCYLVACNAAGIDGKGRSFPGLALILNPKGAVLAESKGWEEGSAICRLTGAEIERIRQTSMGHFVSRRRPELYGGLCAPPSSGP